MLGPSGSAAVVVVLLWLALAIWPSASMVATSRLRRLATPVDRAAQGGGTDTPMGTGGPRAADHDPGGGFGSVQRRALLFAGIAGSAILATFPSLVGGLLAMTASAVSYAFLRGPPAAGAASSRVRTWMAAIPWPGGIRARGHTADSTLPFSIDLLAVCLRAGMPSSSALRSVAGNLSGAGHLGHPERAAAHAVGVPGVSVVLARVAAAIELGGEPATAWEDWIGHPSYGPLARAMVVTGESGSAVADRLEAVSNRLRITDGQQAMVRSQRAGVALMAPLGLCFLPAFVCLGVLPVVVGIAGRVFG